MDLTERQIELLNAIIKEHILSTEPVGSQTLVEKYNLRVSPATVRNEMAELIRQGFLQMLHTSSGRIPTTMGFRFFVDSLLEESELPILQEVAMKQRLWPVRFEFEKMLRHAALSLSDTTKKLALATTYDGHMFYGGSVYVLENPEFWEINVAKAALGLLDNHELLHSLFEKAPSDRDVKMIIGDETGLSNLQSCSLIFSPYKAGRRSGVVAVLGPARMEYSSVIPAVRYTKNLLEELGANW
ncbi:hypothetical protein HY419_00825 [candidate division WWE3 bacterium]|nr:hypothetical protein [candidate division WWE3 bacterium]